MKPEIIAASEGKSYAWSQDHIVVKSNKHITDGRITLVEDTLKPGFHLARHYHKQTAEIFYILDGHVTFRFDDAAIIASPGTTVNIPVNTWHEVVSENGCRLLTIFSPGGFEDYLEILQNLTQDELVNSTLMNDLSERHDIWMR